MRSARRIGKRAADWIALMDRLSMILSENRYTLFRIMLRSQLRTPYFLNQACACFQASSAASLR
ncbi:hypothetical protein ACVWZZ_002010 [Bradyrhizobium sp. LM6.10]